MWRSHASRMARLRLHGLRLPGLRPRRPISGPQHRRRRRAVPSAHRRLCVGCLGDDQAKGRARAPRLCSLQQLWRIDAITGQALHELRRNHAQMSNCWTCVDYRQKISRKL